MKINPFNRSVKRTPPKPTAVPATFVFAPARASRHTHLDWVATDMPREHVLLGDVFLLEDDTGDLHLTVLGVDKDRGTVRVEMAGVPVDLRLITFGDIIPFTDGMVATRFGLRWD